MVAVAPIVEAEHDVLLQGAFPVDAGTGPSIIQRTDQDFIKATLAELAGPTASSVVANHPPASAANALKLFQPMHRTFNLALLEAHCDTFMSPRLDPRKIDSAGLVIRRVTPSGYTYQYEGWCTANGVIQGWTPLPAGDAQDRDPDPARRAATRLTADPTFDLAFRGAPDPTAETYSALFVAPPATATATSRTIIYGVIPVTSSDRAGAVAQSETPPDQATWSQHLRWPLKASTAARDLGLPAGTLATNDAANYISADFILLVLQLRQEFGLFRDDAPARAAQVLALLDGLTLTLSDGSTQTAGIYLATAAKVLIDRDASISVARPTSWPAVGDALANQLYSVLRPLADDVRLALVAPNGSAGRFDDQTSLYMVRAFIRVKRANGCPPRLVWSDYSRPFTIAAWYEGGPAAPVQIALPDPFDPAFLKSVKPGIAFAVPAKLANFLNTDGKTLLNGGQGSGLTLDWICGFSIPIITICAFIVLSLFLSLFNLIFFWLPFVKICIPFPRKK